MTTYRIFDKAGKLIQEVSDENRCQPDGEPPCGGCGHCLMVQAEYNGFRVEVADPTPPCRKMSPWGFHPLWSSTKHD